jgi:metacaspase-1
MASTVSSAPKVKNSTKNSIKNPAKKPQALSLHLGLNAVSPVAYGGWSGPLAACEFDAKDLAALAKTRGIKTTLLLTQKATRAALLGGLRSAAKTLKVGDFFLLSYSGHGGQMPDTNADEDDGQDETWCLFDGQLLDDELYFELNRFAKGVRVLVLSDSCHSGTVTREGPPSMSAPPQPDQRPRLMPAAVGRRVYAEHKAFYDKLQADVAAAARKVFVEPDAALAAVAVSAGSSGAAHAIGLVGQFQPTVVLISGCQDNQVSMDGEHNGAFTEQLLKVWNLGGFVGNYASFHQQIRAKLPATQSPNLFVLGDTSTAAAFLKLGPFSV